MEITFTGVTIQGGGKLLIVSGEDMMTLKGESIHVESGGVLEADYVSIEVTQLLVDSSAAINANFKVLCLEL